MTPATRNKIAAALESAKRQIEERMTCPDRRDMKENCARCIAGIDIAEALALLEQESGEDDLRGICARAVTEIESLTGGGFCGCNGTPPLCIICELRSASRDTARAAGGDG